VTATSTARGDRARDEILSAARWVLLERGVEGMSLREVARRANYSPAALYNHFADKNALVAAVAMECVGSLTRYLGQVPSGGDARQRLRELGLAYSAFADENPAEYAIIFDCLSTPPHPWNDYIAVAHPFTVIVAACEQGLAEGTLADAANVGPAGMAYGLWCLVDGHVHLRAKHLAAVDGPYPAMFAASLDALVAGLSVSSGAPVPSNQSTSSQGASR